MDKKTYISKSATSITVMLPGNISAFITFAPVVNVGNIFVTTDEVLQQGIEAHEKYGKLFTLSKIEASSTDITEPTPSYYKKKTYPIETFVNVESVDDLPEEGSVYVIYRIAGENSYTEMAWNGAEYITLDTRTLPPVITDQQMDAALA